MLHEAVLTQNLLKVIIDSILPSNIVLQVHKYTFYKLAIIIDKYKLKIPQECVGYCFLILQTVVNLFDKQVPYVIYLQKSMADSDHFFFSKKYKVAVKHDQDAFNIRYQLNEERDSSPTETNSNTNPISHPQKYQQQSNDKKKHHVCDKQTNLIQDNEIKKPKNKHHKKHEYIQKKHEDAEQKQQTKSETKLISVQSEKLENLPRQISPTLSEKITKSQKQVYSNIDLIPLKTRISEIEEEQELEAQNINKESIPLINNYSSSKKILRQQSIYINYKSIKEIEESRDNNENIYFRGRVQFSSEVKWNARIYSDEKDGYLLAEGKQNLNRALHQDQVYFKVVQEQKEYVACKIVAIISRRNKELVGKIQKTIDLNGFFLRPINRKIAKMTVSEFDFDKKWIQLFETHYFLCEFVSWQRDQSFPICKVIDVYGQGGDINVETKALLKTYGVQQNKSNKIPNIIQSFGNFFEKDMQFRIPEQEIKKRKDFRKWRTFVVQDTLYDVAFSILPQITRAKGDPNFLKKNIYQINIHILDLAFFVNRSPALDESLRSKMTRFNLAYKIIPMLPQYLIKATSFELNKERLTLSICVQVCEDGTILDSVKAATSVIAPQCILTKAQLQKWIKTQKMPLQELKTFNSIFKMQSEFAIFGKDLKSFCKIMNKARSLRIEQGAFNFQPPIKGFEFDQKNRPIRFELKEKTEIDFIIQECIVISQTKIAEFMMKRYKEKAILYRHRYPGLKMLERLKILTAKAGYPIEDPEKQIHKSINSILSDQKVKQVVKQAIKYLISKLIQNSDYFQSEAEDPTKWNNFAFNVAMFTHCVLPTKKYGDILVQKQLVALIQHQQFKVQNLKKVLEQVNKGTLRSRKIRVQSQKIILCHYLRQHPAFTTGILLQLFEWGLKVCVTKYGFKTIIKFEDISSLKIIKSDVDANNRKYVKVKFKSKSPEIETFFVLKQLQEIEVQVRCSKTIPYNYQVALVMPNPADNKEKLLIQ